MNTTIKKEYNSPEIKQIRLDNEISLQLESYPPIGPGEGYSSNTPEFINSDPFKILNT